MEAKEILIKTNKMSSFLYYKQQLKAERIKYTKH